MQRGKVNKASHGVRVVGVGSGGSHRRLLSWRHVHIILVDVVGGCVNIVVKVLVQLVDILPLEIFAVIVRVRAGIPRGAG
jgi:hypothetical protein